MTTERVSTVVIGAGHAGLAASHFLTAHGIDHLVLERGEVANTWRTERWDSLRLLTPNWLNRLPGLPYDGPEPDGYMTRDEVVELLERYAAAVEAPVRTGCAVESVRLDDPDGPGGSGGYRVAVGDGSEIACRAVVLASGAFNRPAIPALAASIPPEVVQVRPGADYRGPDALPDGGVLVVGASATGVQLAAEIRRSGRPVVLSVGEHVRMPRVYRGRDVLWWMDATGLWDERYDEVDDVRRARRLPSPQLSGSAERVTLDLAALGELGVELVGRWGMLRDGVALFSGGLRNVCALADLKLERLLDGFDGWAAAAGLDADLEPPSRLAPTPVPASPRTQLDLGGGEISTIVWATGFAPDYSWLDVPVLDRKGQLRHDGGVVLDSPGLYALGLPVLRRRRSTFLHGIEDDAREVIGHLAGYLEARGGLDLAPASAR